MHLDKICIVSDIRDSNEADFLAIIFSLELSSEKEWLKQGSLIVESDSKVVLAWVKTLHPYNLFFYGINLLNLLWILKNVTFTHRNRESNHIADSLTKEGASLEGRWIKWVSMIEDTS